MYETLGDDKCGFRRSRSTIGHIFCIRQIMEKNCEQNGSVHQLFVDFMKAYDSVTREVLYSILSLEYQRLVRLICIDGVSNRVRIGNLLSDPFRVHSDLKRGGFIPNAF
ncbi:hypothetical protein L798_00412 [Zootermopsis nevadensis]|uniref:Reverse transcriptase domain-containing protein n=1 Tax=Zootermopsis nevadensis TaxID=136037 RepID=A0A067QKX9_ZOONE|nr:hypothetical protein L798_00412 [Zootermopsis nevadensis]